jgi:hypothetical protein
MATLIPEYLNVDYNTLSTRLKNLIKNDATFVDTDYEGANITLLIELMAYIGELNTYYINKLAKNVFIDTADQYETMHSLASQIGYYPKGYRSARATLTVSLGPSAYHYVSVGDQIYVPSWKQISTTTSINFSNPVSYSGAVTDLSTHSFSLSAVQGDVTTYSYTGNDIVDNEILLPEFDFAYDNDLDDSVETIELSVNGELWFRISDFYDEISGLTSENNVYMFVYDKYGRSKILFNSSRNVPDDIDEIEIVVLRTLGEDGTAAVNTITVPETEFLYNTTTSTWIPYDSGDNFTVTNATATRSSDDVESIEELRENAKGGLHSQYRNTTSIDYVSHLESRSDVVVANVWGENEIAPSGSILEYNKVHISVIPDEWGTGTINYTTSTWTPDGSSTSDSIIVPTNYNIRYENRLKEYLEPRKYLTTYEMMDLPDLVYFSFGFGIRLKRLYNMSDVQNDVLDKLIQFFYSSNREFGEIIDQSDIYEYIMDTSIIDENDSTNEFEYIKGIRNLNIRDLDCNKSIYEPNSSYNYPYYTTAAYSSDIENKLRPVQLGHNQFPILSSDTTHFTLEI